MQLEWFRHHKNFVYWILLPASVLSLAILYTTDVSRKHSVSSKGPFITYVLDGVNYYMNPAQVIEKRALLTKFDNHNRYGKQEVMRHVYQFETAQHAGFEIGPNEVQEDMRQVVRRQSRQDVAKEEYYKILLETSKLTESQFEELTREFFTIGKYTSSLEEHVKASDGELFSSYAREKEVVRMRYKVLKSEDFFDKTTVPADDKIKEYYEQKKKIYDAAVKDEQEAKNEQEKSQAQRAVKEVVGKLKDVMFTKPKLSADVLYLDIEKLGPVAPEPDELQKFYDQNKDKYWKNEVKAGATPPADKDKYKALADVKADAEAKWRDEQVKHYYDLFGHQIGEWRVPPKVGEAPPKPGEEKIKPFEEVKDDAAKRWEVEEKNHRATARMSRMRDTLDNAEKDFKTAQAARPGNENNEFDVHAWAAQQGLVHWVTDELTKEEYESKGSEDVNAKNFKPVNTLFTRFEEPQQMDPRLAQFYQRMRKDFSNPTVYGKGMVIYRAKKYTGEQPAALQDSREALIKRIRLEDSIDAARKEAGRLHDDWALGKDLPALNTLDEAKGDSTSENKLIKMFLQNPKAIGEVADVVEESADPKKPDSNPNMRFYIGFAVDRKLPTYSGFNADTVWDRDQKRDNLQRIHWGYEEALFNNITKGHASSEADPPLAGGSSDD